MRAPALSSYTLAVPRYVIERFLGDVSDAELDAAAKESERLRLEGFPLIDWEHSHVVRVPGGLRSYCIYRAPDEQTIRDHAARAGLPVDHILEIHTDIVPGLLADRLSARGRSSAQCARGEEPARRRPTPTGDPRPTLPPCRPPLAAFGASTTAVPSWSTIQAMIAWKSPPAARMAARSTTWPPEACGRDSLVTTSRIASSST